MMDNRARTQLAEMNDVVQDMPNSTDKSIAAILVYIAATLEEIKYEIALSRD